MDNCRACAIQSLNFLQRLKSKVSIKGADPASVRAVIQKVLQIAQVRQKLDDNKMINLYNECDIFASYMLIVRALRGNDDDNIYLYSSCNSKSKISNLYNQELHCCACILIFTVFVL